MPSAIYVLWSKWITEILGMFQHNRIFIIEEDFVATFTLILVGGGGGKNNDEAKHKISGYPFILFNITNTMAVNTILWFENPYP